MTCLTISQPYAAYFVLLFILLKGEPAKLATMNRTCQTSLKTKGIC